MIRLGASILSWIPQWSSEAGNYAIQKAASLGFDLLEIPLPAHLKLDGPALRAATRKAGLELSFSLILPKEAHMPFYPHKALLHLKKAIDFVEKAGGQFLGGVLYSARCFYREAHGGK